MKLNKSKRGISLIVLVITIVVMIILAAAIILSLNSSNISGKANEAKLSSDLSNKKEAATVYLSQYEINVAKGKIDKNATSADAYVKAEMKKAGLSTDDILVTEEGNILVGIAAVFVNKDIPIGTEVKGYKLNNTKTYRTSGKENTCDLEEFIETAPQPATLNRYEEIEWEYFGIDENGNALIVGGIYDNPTQIGLGGKGGYLYGPQELNNASKALYSSNMGTARSINIDDVIRVLEYTGERGSYGETSGENYFPTKQPLTIREVVSKQGHNIEDVPTETPEVGVSIGEYKSNWYCIDREEDKGEYNIAMADIIFPSDNNPYWLASNFCRYDIWGKSVVFCVGNIDGIDGWPYMWPDEMFYSDGSSGWNESALRPVVQLNPNVDMTYSNGVVILK